MYEGDRTQRNIRKVENKLHLLKCICVCTECDCVHGVCNKGPEGDGQCLCQPPYTGKRCDKGKLMTHWIIFV